MISQGVNGITLNLLRVDGLTTVYDELAGRRIERTTGRFGP
jgi:hypothetical protein